MAEMMIPEKYDSLADRAKNGSRKAASRLFCLHCTGWSLVDVRECTAPECPLFRYRQRG